MLSLCEMFLILSTSKNITLWPPVCSCVLLMWNKHDSVSSKGKWMYKMFWPTSKPLYLKYNCNHGNLNAGINEVGKSSILSSMCTMCMWTLFLTKYLKLQVYLCEAQPTSNYFYITEYSYKHKIVKWVHKIIF